MPFFTPPAGCDDTAEDLPEVIALNLATNIVLVRLLQQGGLALGMSIAATLNAILLGRALRGRLRGLEGRAILRTAARAFIGVVPMAAVVALTMNGITQFSVAGGFVKQLAAVVAAVGAGALTYLIVQLLLRSEEVGVVLSVLRRR